jgi:hypothetical protein
MAMATFKTSNKTNNPSFDSKCIVEPHGSKSVTTQVIAHINLLKSLICNATTINHNTS